MYIYIYLFFVCLFICCFFCGFFGGLYFYLFVCLFRWLVVFCVEVFSTFIKLYYQLIKTFDNDGNCCSAGDGGDGSGILLSDIASGQAAVYYRIDPSKWIPRC